MLFSRNELKPLLNQVATNDPDLTSLHLSHKKITNKQLVQISEALKTNTHITEIWLTNNQISEDDKGGEGSAGSVGYLMGVLETNRTVGEVYLGGNKIGTKGASSIAALLQINSVITDIGLDDNEICNGGAKMLADALEHNNTLQTLKLQGNNIQAESTTLKSIHDLLKKNKDSAKARFEEEHPELKTHKLKKPEPKKKKKSSSRSSGDRRKGSSSRDKDKEGRSSSDGDRRRSSKEGGSSKSRSSRPASSSSGSGSDRKQHPGEASSAPFLDEQKKAPPEESNKPSPLTSKFKGFGLGGKKQNNDGLNHDGLKDATFV